MFIPGPEFAIPDQGSETGFRIRIRIQSGQRIRSGSVFAIRIRIQEGKNDPQKAEKPAATLTWAYI